MHLNKTIVIVVLIKHIMATSSFLIIKYGYLNRICAILMTTVSAPRIILQPAKENRDVNFM